MSFICNENSMLPLSREWTIFRLCSPIIFIKFWGIFSKIHHWLNSEYHSGLHLGSCIFCCLMVYIGFLMKLKTNSMPCIITNHWISSRLDILRYCISNITKKIPWSNFCYTDFPSFFCYCDQIFCFFTHISYRIHTRCITKISIYNGSYINIENISLLEYLISTRNTMTDNIIEGDTCTTRISSFSPLICSLVVNTSWNPSIRENESIHNIIEFKCRYPCSNIGTNHIESHSSQLSCLTNSLYLFRSFDNNFRHFYDFSKNRFAV